MEILFGMTRNNHSVPELLDAVKAICNEAIIVHEKVLKSISGTP